MRRGVNGLKPEMTSIASARQAATMIKNGKKERGERKSELANKSNVIWELFSYFCMYKVKGTLFTAFNEKSSRK